MKRILLIALILNLFSCSGWAAYSGWDYKTKIKVNNPTGNTRTDYPVRIEIPGMLLIEAGRTNSDLRDIRFSDGSGNELPFWIDISEGMQRKVNNMPVYVRLKTLSPGDNIVYLHFDKTKSQTDSPPGGSYCGDFTPTSETRRTCSPSSGSFPYTHDDCGDGVFSPGLFAYTSRDSDDWYFTEGSDMWGTPSGFGEYGERWVSKKRFRNNFCFHFRGHYYGGQETWAYFLTQHWSDPPWNLISYKGYRLYVDYIGDDTDDYHWNRKKHLLTIQRNLAGGWNQWVDVASFDWFPYHNSIHDFEIKVTSSKIEVWINGLKLGEVTRNDNFNSGYVGFQRLSWQSQGECGSNSMDGISPQWVIDNFVGGDPIVEVIGQTDIEIKRIKPTSDPGFIGKDIIEYVPKKQILEDNVTENNIEHYVYSTYTLANLETQVFKYTLKVRNRGDATQTFDISLNVPTGEIGKSWFIAYDYGSSGWIYNLPNGDLYNGWTDIGAGSEWEMDIFVMPSDRALFQSGLGKLILDFEVQSQGDFSFDTAKFVSDIVPRPQCSYWKWKLPITISYNDIYGTGDLIDYQVLVPLSGISQLSDAQPDGRDIIFLDEAGSMVSFWIKSLDTAAGKGSFWVKVPRIPPGTKTIYMFWGNPDYLVARSNIKETFDMWEDWESRILNEVVGCPDGTSDCISQRDDPEGWENIPTPDDNFNWWRIKNRLDGQAVMARGQTSNDIGPFVVGGDVRWKSYEVIYSFYDEYNTYSSGYGNPQYNPVFHQDPGNTWGMEFFNKMFIFRPFAYGTDWTWTYQSNPGNILNDGFPVQKKRYWIKIKLFKNPVDQRAYLRMLIAKSTPGDIDSDAGFFEVTENPGTGFAADPAFALEGGMIGFGGWNGGFSYDNIRVRKFTSPEPTVAVGSAELVEVAPIRSLSFPTLTPPLMNGRSVFIRSLLTPWKWFGNIEALYADCLISGDCRSGEDKAKLGTISLWDKINPETPKGCGDHLMEETAGDNNSSGRKIYTAYDSNSDTIIDSRLNFEINQANILGPLMGTGITGDTQELIRFVRGKYVGIYPRSQTRDMDGSHAENKQWKLSDVIHSNPLVVGIPNMVYADDDYGDFVDAWRERDLVTYFGSNEGMLHAVRLAEYNAGDNKYNSDKEATELWSFIPNEVLPKLRDTTDNYHEYLTDGLLRAIDAKIDGDYKTVLIGSMRTGGATLFALDVTDPGQAPEFLWEINKTTNRSEFEKIGETSSSPALGRLRINGSASDPYVAIIGSGFDPYDIKNLSKTAYLTVVDLKDGSIIKQIEVSSKLGNITTNLALLRDKAGYLEKIYFGDYYGCLWRINLSTTTEVNDFLGKTILAEEDMLFKPSDYASSDMLLGPEPERPISAPPILGMAEEETIWAYFGTGSYDDYDPGYPYQKFYGLKDVLTTPYQDGGLVDMTNSSNTNLDQDSWHITLGTNDNRDYDQETGQASVKDRNERVLTTPEVYGGFVFFTTWTPNDDPCGGGVTRFYSVGYKSGGYEGGLIKGVEDAGTEKTDVRSIIPSDPSAKSSVPSKPMIYVGQSESGEPVAKGLVNLGTGELTEIELDPSKFAEILNILLWREIK